MPRKLKLIPQEGLDAIEATMRKFTRSDIYGKSSVETRTEGGETLNMISVTPDGSNFLISGSTSSQYVDLNGEHVGRRDVIPTDEEGNPLEMVEDMFKSELSIQEEITLEDFFCYNFTSSYVLESEGDLSPLKKRCQELVKQERFLKFSYAYYATAYPQDAILIPVEEEIVVAVGSYAPTVWAKLTMNLEEVYIEEEDEGEDEFGFEDVW